VNFRELPRASLPEGEVLIEVLYSCLNYKDGLAITGPWEGHLQVSHGPAALTYAVGRSNRFSDEFHSGDEVLAVGQGLGETIWSGYSQRAQLPAKTLVHVPQGLTPKRAMAIGTAGFTAMLALMSLEHSGVKADGREVIVTGAAGGVGSVG
jgi:acrylyl-CoA reductase (NADPH)